MFLQDNFFLSLTEGVEYQCKHKRVGTLYLTETHMAFVTKTLGFEKKAIIGNVTLHRLG